MLCFRQVTPLQKGNSWVIVNGMSDIDPYLNPNYWGGHMLGDGAPTPDSDFWKPPLYSLPDSAMREILRQGLALPQTEPQQTLQDGDVFDPEEWPSGTIVLLDRERLEGWRDNRRQRLPVVEGYEDHELPDRPRDLHQNLGILEHQGSVYAKRPGLRVLYMRAAHWGVVAATIDSGRKTLGTWSTNGVRRNEDGTIWAARTALPIALPLEIGATRHFLKRSEQLERVNTLHVHRIGTGERQRKPSPLRVFLGRLAFGEPQ